MSVRIYVEGGGDNKDTLKRCKEGFASYCQKLTEPDRRPSVIACGGRQQTYNRFITAVNSSAQGQVCVLLVDAESAVTEVSAIRHLFDRDQWAFPSGKKSEVHLMVQAMEAWFLADRPMLINFYGAEFLANSLPANPAIEAISKDDLEPRLKHASKPTKTKGEYHKTKHGFALLALVDPLKVERASPYAKAFNDFLRSI